MVHPLKVLIHLANWNLFSFLLRNPSRQGLLACASYNGFILSFQPSSTIDVIFGFFVGAARSSQLCWLSSVEIRGGNREKQWQGVPSQIITWDARQGPLPRIPLWPSWIIFLHIFVGFLWDPNFKHLDFSTRSCGILGRGLILGGFWNGGSWHKPCSCQHPGKENTTQQIPTIDTHL